MGAPGSPPPWLVVGLGNALAGDDGIGARLAQHLREHPALPAGVEVLDGGTDLLRLAGALRGRRAVILVDAMVGAETGRLEVEPHGRAALSRVSTSAHGLSAPGALDLLLLQEPALAATRFTWALVSVHDAVPGAALSAALEAAVPALAARLLALLDAETDG